MYNLVHAFMHFHYDLSKATLQSIIADIEANGYFDDEQLESKVIEVIAEVYQEWLDNL